MEIYRSPMEKILKQEENNTVITNPQEPENVLAKDRLPLCLLAGKNQPPPGAEPVI